METSVVVAGGNQPPNILRALEFVLANDSPDPVEDSARDDFSRRMLTMISRIN